MKKSNKAEKLFYLITHPNCWNAFIKGVAPGIEHRKVLKGIEFDLLIDIGANKGQFSLVALERNPNTRVYAFEPQPLEASIYRSIFKKSTNITLYQFALGAESKEAKMYISRRRDSSSLLPISEIQERIFPKTNLAKCETVSVRTLDSFATKWNETGRILVKIDVQGFELEVLKGANSVLRKASFLYVECSNVSFYHGQALYSDVRDFLEKAGYCLRDRTNEHYDGDKLVQADFLFENLNQKKQN